MANLTGNEILQVQGVDANGFPAATTQTVTVSQFASATNAPISAGATKTLTAANLGGTVLLNTAAGSAVTLPAATGSGGTITFVVTTTTTSGAHKILPASSSDYMQGYAIGEDAGTNKSFASDGTSNHSIQMPYSGSQPSGGFIGDRFEATDIAKNLWQVTGVFQAGTTPTTPFSTSTT